MKYENLSRLIDIVKDDIEGMKFFEVVMKKGTVRGGIIPEMSKQAY